MLNSPAYSIGQANRGDDIRGLTYTQTPAPATYEIKENLTIKKIAPSYTFSGGKPGRQFYDSSSTPGPGTYTEGFGLQDAKIKPNSYIAQTYIHGRKRSGPAYSVGTGAMMKPDKHKDTVKTRIIDFKMSNLKGPTPATYHPEKPTHKPPAFVFGYKTESSLFRPGHDAPGPGAYDVSNSEGMTSHDKRAVKIGSSTRPPLYQTGGDTPAPNHYFNPDDAPKGTNQERIMSAMPHYAPKFSFGNSTRDELYRTDKTPGPGKYEVKTYLSTTTGFSITGKPDSKPNGRGDRKSAHDTPGPGVYEINDKFARKTAPAFK